MEFTIGMGMVFAGLFFGLYPTKAPEERRKLVSYLFAAFACIFFALAFWGQFRDWWPAPLTAEEIRSIVEEALRATPIP